MAKLPRKLPSYLGGSVYHAEINGQTGRLSMVADRTEHGKKKHVMVENDLMEFIHELQEKVSFHLSKLPLHSCYTRKGHIFRGDFSYRKNVWRDWVVINWGSDGKLPNRIYGFVDLTSLPANLPRSNRISHGGLSNIKPAIYAIVEATVVGCEGAEGTDLFDVLQTEVGELRDGLVSKFKFYLADIETFQEPCVVVPNVGGPNNCYFWLEPKSRWSELFVKWLRAPHHEDEQEDLTALDKLAAAEAMEQDG
jgi:hypothetical protein